VSAFENARSESAQKNHLLLEEQSGLNSEVSRLEGERLAAASSISPEDMRLYDQLRAQRRGIAVAKVTDRACSACGSTLNATLLQAAHSPSQIARCDTCGRILYSG
jgi:predicted  nucleic acid-binding Zn-ribbon protein